MSENLLRHEVSPYLLQHQDNPVHWRPWGTDALDEARATGKPILLSVGYAACHWCHVMAHESFEDPSTAEVMNSLFVNIKVDREERPDIDQIYMNALHTLGEQGGWPLTMFLTPDGEPIWGGTYFPPIARYGRPAFTDMLKEVARLFREEPGKIEQNRDYIRAKLAEKPTDDGIQMGPALLDAAADRLLSFMDPENGGTRGAPKFPQAALFETMWRAHLRTGDARYRDVFLTTLRHIAAGGIYDHIAGGFARYSVDDRWLVPHFEKMLYDNAQIIELMTYGWLATREDVFRERVAETIAWLEREMRGEGGAFFASLDADAEGHEGKFTIWAPDEVVAILGPEDGAWFNAIYDITPAGNFEGKSIPNRLGSIDRLHHDDERRLETMRAKVLAKRAERVRPGTDDKILADWNGLTIAALAFAAQTFNEPHWLKLSEDAFSFVTRVMTRGGRLAHATRDGRFVYPGLSTDYAAMTKAALALHAATADPSYLEVATGFATTLREHHWDSAVPGYYLSADDAEALILRPRSATDDATPSATSLMTQNLIRLWHLTGNDVYRSDADAILAASGSAVANNVFGSTALLNALDLRLRATDVIILRAANASADHLVRATRGHWTPNTVMMVFDESVELSASHPAHGKTTVEGSATAYVCRGKTCSLPVTETGALERMLATYTSIHAGIADQLPSQSGIW